MEKLLEEIGHIGELGRVLHAFSDRKSQALSKTELVAIVNQTAGMTSRYPRPYSALKLLIFLGLLKRDKNIYKPTPLGLEYLREGIGNLVDPTLRQNRLLLGLILDDLETKSKIQSLFTHFRSDSEGFLKARAVVMAEASLDSIAKLLQQLQCLQYQNGFLILNPDFEELLHANQKYLF